MELQAFDDSLVITYSAVIYFYSYLKVKVKVDINMVTYHSCDDSQHKASRFVTNMMEK